MAIKAKAREIVNTITDEREGRGRERERERAQNDID